MLSKTKRLYEEVSGFEGPARRAVAQRISTETDPETPFPFGAFKFLFSMETGIGKHLFPFLVFNARRNPGYGETLGLVHPMIATWTFPSNGFRQNWVFWCQLNRGRRLAQTRATGRRHRRVMRQLFHFTGDLRDTLDHLFTAEYDTVNMEDGATIRTVKLCRDHVEDTANYGIASAIVWIDRQTDALSVYDSVNGMRIWNSDDTRNRIMTYMLEGKYLCLHQKCFSKYSQIHDIRTPRITTGKVCKGCGGENCVVCNDRFMNY